MASSDANRRRQIALCIPVLFAGRTLGASENRGRRMVWDGYPCPADFPVCNMYGDCTNALSGASINGYNNQGADCYWDHDDPTSCYTCIKNSIGSTLQSSCKSGTVETVKSIIQSSLGGTYPIFSQPTVEALDVATLAPLGFQTAEEACELCVDEIGRFLQQQDCSCNSMGFAAGLELDRVSATSQCSSSSDYAGGQGAAGAACEDVPASWIDIAKKGCEHYQEMEYCTSSGGYGQGWLPEKGLFSEWGVDGVAADRACCACGGGSTGNFADGASSLSRGGIVHLFLALLLAWVAKEARL